MENIENVKKMVSALKSINQDIERKPKCFMTPLQVKATEETLYKISGIKVNINSIRDFKELEEYYQKKYWSKDISDYARKQLTNGCYSKIRVIFRNYRKELK